jgi:hydrogenase maturation protease
VATTLVLGVGNVLLCDDGAGILAMRELESSARSNRDVHFVDGGTLSFILAPLIESAERLLVLDAAQFDAAPGTVRCMLDEDMDRFLGGPRRSVHEVSLLDLLDMARLTGCLPRERALIGIQPARIDWGDTPTEAVRSGIDEAVGIATRLLEQWGGRSGPRTSAAIAS